MNRVFVTSVAALLCWVFSACSSAMSFDITVAAGKQERKNVPVRVQLPPDQLGTQQVAWVVLTGPDGKSIPAQWTKANLVAGAGNELHFILPHLAAGETVQLKATLA